MVDDDNRSSSIFLRLTPKEKKVIEAAAKIRYGRSRGHVSGICRQAALAWASKIIRAAKEKRGN